MNESKLRFLFRFIFPHRKRFLLIVLSTVFKAVLVMLPPLIIKEIFDQVITGGNQDNFWMLAMLLLTIPLGIALMTFVQILDLAIFGQRIIFEIRNAIFKRLEELSLRFYNRYGTGLLINRLMGDTSTMQSVISNSLVVLISDIVICTIACAAALILNWRLGCILIAIVALFVANYQYLKYRLIDSKRKTLNAVDQMTEGVQERLNLNLTVRTYGREPEEQQVFDDQTDLSVLHGSQSGKSNVDFASNTELLTFLGWGIIYFAACSMYLDGLMTYGAVIAFTTYAMQVLTPAVRFSNLARQIQDVTVALDRIFEIYNQEPEIKDTAKPVSAKNIKGKVDFNAVDFHYEAGKPVIRKFDLHVQAGESIALVGTTGCGKSTILNLIFRFYDVCGGSIKIDNHDIRNYRINELRHHFGIVLQEPLLFEDTIANNIRYANPALSMDKVIEAADMAEIHSYIEKLDNGYNTLVGGRNGISLSAGQQQQLTIARAIAADPAILVMDEATSNLDSESEAKIQRALDRVLKNRTCFVVAHRLSTIRNASRIVYMDSGRILECGSHEELLTMDGGHYRNLYEKHLEQGVLEED